MRLVTDVGIVVFPGRAMDVESVIEIVVESLLKQGSFTSRIEARDAVFAAWEEPLGFHFRTLTPRRWAVRLTLSVCLLAVFVFAGWMTGDIHDVATAAVNGCGCALVALLFVFAYDLLHLRRSIAITRDAILCFGHSQFTAHYWNRSTVMQVDLLPTATADNRFGCEVMVVHRKYASPRIVAVRAITLDSLAEAIAKLGVPVTIRNSSTVDDAFVADPSLCEKEIPRHPMLDETAGTP